MRDKTKDPLETRIALIVKPETKFSSGLTA